MRGEGMGGEDGVQWYSRTIEDQKWCVDRAGGERRLADRGKNGGEPRGTL